MKFSFWLLFALMWGVARPSFAQNQNNQCAKILNAKELLKCAQEISPDTVESNLELQRATTAEAAAGQWRNPEFSLNSVQGKRDGENVGETDLALSFPIELGGKLSARSAIAKAESNRAEASLEAGRARVQSEIILKLHRLQQVYHERDVIGEAITTFSKLLEQLSRRPGLSPEQQVSSVVYRMAKSEYEIKRHETVGELMDLDLYFRVNVGKSIEEIRSVPIPAISSWPSVQNQTGHISALVREAEAEVERTRGELSVAQSESWPTISVGPSVKLQQEAGQSTSLVGFNLSLPIPVFNVNGAGRSAAAKALLLSEARTANLKKQELARRAQLVSEYEQAKNTLKLALSHDEIERRHREVESLFLKGLVPSSLVIEAHRAYVDLEKSRNQLELKAIQNLHLIAIIDGQPVEFGL